jgi:hypothetical protein
VAARDHIAVLLYAIEQGHDPVPPHVVQLAMSAIAAAGFDPAARVILDDEAAAADESQQQRAGDAVAPSEFNYLRYARARRQWPEEVTRSSYLRDLRDVALDPRAGLLLCNAGSETAALVVVSPPPPEEPSRGSTIVVVDPSTRRWMEGFRAEDVEEALRERGWGEVRWLRDTETAR